MNEINKRKKESSYLMLISQIIKNDVTNVNISNTTVVDVKLSNDGSHLKIYVAFDRMENRSLESLKKAKGFIRTMLSQYELGRSVPRLDFELDVVGKKALEIDKILQEIKDKK
ncbi:MAG: 30S ribosome-binding factor RbfA [Mycoplasmataceae bacterium]|nr:30S ribosome-binding factor RbfA [Mycoplasmataceae bacterium]